MGRPSTLRRATDPENYYFLDRSFFPDPGALALRDSASRLVTKSKTQEGPAHSDQN